MSNDHKKRHVGIPGQHDSEFPTKWFHIISISYTCVGFRHIMYRIYMEMIMYDITCLKHLSQPSHQTRHATLCILGTNPKQANAIFFQSFQNHNKPKTQKHNISKEIFRETQKKADVQSVIKCSFKCSLRVSRFPSHQIR